MKKITLLLTLLALTARAQTDPYAQLPAYDFGKDAAPVTAIAKEVFDTKPAGYPAIEAKLLAALAKPDATYAAKKFICEQLRIVGSHKSVGALAALLGGEQTAPLARFALETLPGPAVDDVLLKALSSATGQREIGLIDTLAARHNEKLVPLLKDRLASNNKELVGVALQALSQVGSPKAAAILQLAKVPANLEPLRERAWVDATFNLAKTGKPAAAIVFEEAFKKCASVPAVIAAMNGLVECRGAAALPTVITALSDKREPVAIAAAKVTQQIEGASATKELCTFLPVLAPPVQVALVRALAERGDKTALPAVKALLTAQDDAVKAEAALALQKLGDASVVPGLIALATGEGDVAGAAQQTLGRINADGVNAAMLKMLDDADAKKVRVAALTLKARADRSVMPRLLTLAASDKNDIRNAALDALDGFAGTSELPALLALLDKVKDRDKLVSVIWKATTALGKEDERFVKLWADGASHQEALISLASTAGGAEPLKIVTSATDNPALKEAAARTLFNWKTDVAVEPVMAIIKTTGDAKLKILGARAVVRLVTDRKCGWKQPRKIETLESLLPSLTRPEDKKMVEDGIEKIKNGKR